MYIHTYTHTYMVVQLHLIFLTDVKEKKKKLSPISLHPSIRSMVCSASGCMQVWLREVVVWCSAFISLLCVVQHAGSSRRLLLPLLRPRTVQCVKWHGEEVHEAHVTARQRKKQTNKENHIRTHARTNARTHERTHARTHTRTHALAMQRARMDGWVGGAE